MPLYHVLTIKEEKYAYSDNNIILSVLMLIHNYIKVNVKNKHFQIIKNLTSNKI